MITDIQNHTPSNQEKYLVDTNILLFLYCPIANHKNHVVQKYSNFFAALVSQKSEIYITSQILSEFINVYLKLDFSLYKNKNNLPNAKYKSDYRSSTQFKSAVSALKSTISGQILKTFKRLDDDFNNCNINNILNNLENIDHNDGYYAELVANKNFNILTDDFDYSIYKASHSIFSGNPRLINA